MFGGVVDDEVFVCRWLFLCERKNRKKKKKETKYTRCCKVLPYFHISIRIVEMKASSTKKGGCMVALHGCVVW